MLANHSLGFLSLSSQGLEEQCQFTFRPTLSCDGFVDDTAALQRSVILCAGAGVPLRIAAGANCTSRPLKLPSDAVVQVDAGAALYAANRSAWPQALDALGALPALISATNATNLTIRGGGVIDGHGEQWWVSGDAAPPYAHIHTYRDAH
jgi:polygalacturonase